MKYRITGLNPTETIKKYKIYKDGIKVKYLKGNKIIPYTDENLKELIGLMEEQAYNFINDYEFEEKITDCQAKAIGLGYAHAILIFGYFYTFFQTKLSPNILFDTSIISLLLGFGYFKSSLKKKSYLEKYRLFLENKHVLKNQELGFLEPITINNLDKKSLQRLKWIIKISRSMEPKKEGNQKRLGEIK